MTLYRQHRLWVYMLSTFLPALLGKGHSEVWQWATIAEDKLLDSFYIFGEQEARVAFSNNQLHRLTEPKASEVMGYPHPQTWQPGLESHFILMVKGVSFM